MAKISFVKLEDINRVEIVKEINVDNTKFGSNDLFSSAKTIYIILSSHSDCGSYSSKPEGFCSSCYFGFNDSSSEVRCALKGGIVKKLGPTTKDKQIREHMLKSCEEYIINPKNQY